VIIGQLIVDNGGHRLGGIGGGLGGVTTGELGVIVTLLRDDLNWELTPENPTVLGLLEGVETRRGVGGRVAGGRETGTVPVRVGDLVGDLVGEKVGDLVGDLVGFRVGAKVGGLVSR